MKSASILGVFLLSLALTFGVAACGRSESVEAGRETDAVTDDRPVVLTDDEKEFVTYASEMHAGEIDLAELAKEKSANQQVKEYADDLIAAHTEALKHLSDRTRQGRSDEGSLDTKSHAEYLKPLAGAQFDREFIALMVADHKDATETFKTELNKVQNKELKQYMEDTVSTLESALSDAQGIEKDLPASKKMPKNK
jgi:putative membrane protein